MCGGYCAEVRTITAWYRVRRFRANARDRRRCCERRAKVIHAEGELQASEKLYQAAKVLAQEPQAIQLRYLETLTVIGADKNTTVIFPLPMELLAPFLPRPEPKTKA